MVEQGFAEECMSLQDRGYDLMLLSDIGYRQMFMYINKLYPMKDVKDSIKMHTRRYAKRQMTWFKNQMDCVFVDMNYDDINKTVDEVSKLIDNYLNK